MRIAVFVKSTTFNKSFGGLETQNKLLCEGLAKSEHEVVVFAPGHEAISDTRYPISEPGNESQIANNELRITAPRYVFVDAPPGKYSPEWWEKSWEIFLKFHQRQPFDVVISQSAAGQEVVRHRRKLGVSTVVIQHGTILGELKTRLRNSRSLEDYLFFFLRLVPYGLKVYLMDQLRLRGADAVIAVSEQVKKALISEYFLPPGKITVVNNGVEISKFVTRDAECVVRKELEIGEDDKVILYVGRVEKEKGLRVLLEALSRLPYDAQRMKLVIVGAGSYLNNLKDLAKRLAISDYVVFTGKVPYENVCQYYAAADVFVLPSLREEGLPMTLPEAMAAGLPIVASRIGGIPAAVEDGKTGILTSPGDTQQLSAALRDLVSDEALRKKLAKAAKRSAQRKFSQEKMVNGTISVIRESLSV